MLINYQIELSTVSQLLYKAINSSSNIFIVKFKILYTHTVAKEMFMRMLIEFLLLSPALPRTPLCVIPFGRLFLEVPE